jgi:hypothetical protein
MIQLLSENDFFCEGWYGINSIFPQFDLDGLDLCFKSFYQSLSYFTWD